MGRRAAVTGAVTGAAALVAAALAFAPSSTVPAHAGAYGSGPFSFPHAPHLSKEGIAAALATRARVHPSLQPEVGSGSRPDAECRVCHDYSKGDEAHLSGCEQCHVGAKHLLVERAAAAAAKLRFPHRAHVESPGVTCFDCHRVQRSMGWVEFTIPDAGLGSPGPGRTPGGKHGDAVCADCHASHEPRGGLVKQDERTGDGKPCAVCHLAAESILPQRLRAGRGAAEVPSRRPFLHADHGGAEANCDDCHGTVRTSRTIWDYDPTAGTAERCRACHVDASGASLVGVASPPRTTTLPFKYFSNFPHDRHLGVKGGRIATSGDVTDGCRTCHFPETASPSAPGGARPFAGRKPSPEPVGREQLVDYDACTPCHADWEVPGHGVGGWSCFKCHSETPDAQGRIRDLAKARVERGEILRGVTFDRLHHPGVTTSGAALADVTEPGGKPCRDCHVGEIDALASRLAGKPFAHAPHLPENPSSADCIVCHTSSATASWSADLTRFDPHIDAPTHASGEQGLAKGCLDCHVGARPEQIGTATTVREVPEFDHKGHVVSAKWDGGKGIPCTECHTAGGAVGYQTPADVASCGRCHSHDEAQTAKFARTGKGVRDAASEEKCRFCHHDVQAHVTASKNPPRRHLSLLPGVQHHDKGGDCAACHAREGTGDRPVYAERIRKAKVLVSIHDDRDLAGEWFNDPRISKPGADPQGRTCRHCHRSDPRGYLRAPGKG